MLGDLFYLLYSWELGVGFKGSVILTLTFQHEVTLPPDPEADYFTDGLVDVMGVQSAVKGCVRP